MKAARFQQLPQQWPEILRWVAAAGAGQMAQQDSRLLVMQMKPLYQDQASTVMNAKQSDKALQFQELHQRQGVFLIPNPWDAGSVRILTSLGFEAFATSSSACAAVLGRRDHRITRAEALAHVRAIASATDRPVSADLENGFGDAPATVAETLIEQNQL
jgi:hypothetical protein